MKYSFRVITAAEAKIRDQSATPMSPGLMVNGVPCLCLAAALAFGGVLEAEGQDAAEEFAFQAANSGAKDILHSTFRRLRWPVSDCEIRLQFNDSLPDEARKEMLLEHLRMLKA